jgi:hypothetical protein
MQGLLADHFPGGTETSMRCERCGGLRVARRFGDDRVWGYDGLLCLNCGNVSDPLITSNRELQARGLLTSMRAKGMRSAGGAVTTARRGRLGG